MSHPAPESACAAADVTPWHVLGAGAIGGLWALRMAAVGIPVTLIAHGDAGASRTLSLQDGEHTSSHTFPQISAASAGDIARLLVATKAGITRAALAPLLPQLRPGSIILLLQNGMGTEDLLCAEHPDLCILNGITTDGIFREGKDRLVQAGHGETWLGCHHRNDEANAKAIAASLSGNAWPVHFVPDIQQRRWQKLAMNCAINPLTALYRCRNGELLEKPDALATMRHICTEAALVMRAEGLDADSETLFKAACETARKTAANISSMRADVDAGRPTEIDFINGYLLRRAAAHGIAVPANSALCAGIAAMSPAASTR
ncbi:MAG: ketopantoate reductase family protein [bacterium]|nr:ketopantoate reductase family protein [bacterium]